MNTQSQVRLVFVWSNTREQQRGQHIASGGSAFVVVAVVKCLH